MNFYNASHFKLVNKSFENMEFAITDITFPSLDCESAEQPAYIPTRHWPGSNLIYSDLSVEILVDEQLKTYREIVDYLKKLTDMSGASYDINDMINDTHVIMYNSDYNPIGKYIFTNSFPVNCSSLNLSVNDNGQSAPTITVDFKFSDMIFEGNTAQLDSKTLYEP